MNPYDKDWKETFRAAAADAGTFVRNAASAVDDGAQKLTGAVKRRLETADLHGEINVRLQELGELLYATHTGTPTDSEALVNKMKEIDDLKARLHAVEGEPVIHLICPVCGHEVHPDDVYCRECGVKL